MPYIDPDTRVAINTLIKPVNLHEWSAGAINYFITKILLKWVSKTSYISTCLVLGTLGCVALEFYRRVAAPYENKKRSENGEVYCLGLMPAMLLVDYTGFALDHPHVFIIGSWIASVTVLIVVGGLLLWVRRQNH